MNRRSHRVAAILGVSLAGVCVAASHEAASTNAAEPEPESSAARPAQPLRPLSREYLEAATKARLQAKQEADAKRARLIDEAQRVAIQFAREKLRRQAEQAREAQRQVQLARERQLKTLYSNALALSKQGAYQEAIELFQQMALIDPAHPLVKAADRFIARAELKAFEQRLRASAESPTTHGASVPELEQRLTQKRIEIETVFKYAKEAMQARKYEAALKLLTAILVQDPPNREAQGLIEQVQLAQLKDEEGRLTRQGDRDDRAMRNEILKAELLPPDRQGRRPAGMPTEPRLTGGLSPAMAAKLQQPISFEFNEVALSDVLEFIADAAGVSVIPSPQLDLKTRLVSLKIAKLPLEQAIRYLAKSLALAYRIDDDAVLISTPEDFSNEPMQTRVFFLRNGLGPFALEASAGRSNPTLAMESVASLIEQSVPRLPNSKFIVDERSGALIVTNTAESLLLVERLMSQLDVTPLQVLIEARFIELTMTEVEQLGLESVLTGDAVLTKIDTSDHTQGPGHQIAGGGGFKFPAAGRKDSGGSLRESEGLSLTLQGVLTGNQFESALHWLEESKQTKTLSAPRVTTLNNQTATIRVVEQFNYPTRYAVSLIQFDINGDGDFDDAGETEFANVPQDFQKRDVGILLNVTPSVGKDMNTITLVLAPEVSQFSQFRDLGGGVSVPEFTSSQLTTSIVIEDGQTVVLGGLMKDATSHQVTKVPFLGDLPLLGALFRQQNDTSLRKNLLIFITARLLGSRGPTT